MRPGRWMETVNITSRQSAFATSNFECKVFKKMVMIERRKGGLLCTTPSTVTRPRKKQEKNPILSASRCQQSLS
mgnify:CR=1 FL=1